MSTHISRRSSLRDKQREIEEEAVHAAIEKEAESEEVERSEHKAKAKKKKDDN